MAASAVRKPENDEPRLPTAKARREAMLLQKIALLSQLEKLAAALAAAKADQNRAVAAAVDGSKATASARDAATATHFRVNTEWSATRDALEQLDKDIAAHDERHRVEIDRMKLRASAGQVRTLGDDARKLDAALAVVVELFPRLSGSIGHLYGSLPSDLKEQVFAGGSMLSKDALEKVVTYALSGAKLARAMRYEPPDHYRTLAALFEHFCRPILDAEAAIPADDPRPKWE